MRHTTALSTRKVDDGLGRLKRDDGLGRLGGDNGLGRLEGDDNVLGRVLGRVRNLGQLRAGHLDACTPHDRNKP